MRIEKRSVPFAPHLSGISQMIPDIKSNALSCSIPSLSTGACDNFPASCDTACDMRETCPCPVALPVPFGVEAADFSLPGERYPSGKRRRGEGTSVSSVNGTSYFGIIRPTRTWGLCPQPAHAAAHFVYSLRFLMPPPPAAERERLLRPVPFHSGPVRSRYRESVGMGVETHGGAARWRQAAALLDSRQR